MKLSDKAIAGFQSLHSKHYGTELTATEAESELMALIRFVAVIQPIDHPIHQVVDDKTVDETDSTAVE
jgi:hypothetical protein